MAKYLLLLRSDITKDMSQYSPDDFQRLIQAYQAWAGGLAERGLLDSGEKLADEEGRVMMAGADGAVAVKDGPYVETKEVVGGFYLINADSYEHAVELCKEHPNFQFGSIEIRQIETLGEPEG